MKLDLSSSKNLRIAKSEPDITQNLKIQNEPVTSLTYLHIVNQFQLTVTVSIIRQRILS